MSAENGVKSAPKSMAVHPRHSRTVSLAPAPWKGCRTQCQCNRPQPVIVTHSNYVVMNGAPNGVTSDAYDNNGAFIRNRSQKIRDITAGLSNMRFIGERCTNKSNTTCVGAVRGAVVPNWRSDLDGVRLGLLRHPLSERKQFPQSGAIIPLLSGGRELPMIAPST